MARKYRYRPSRWVRKPKAEKPIPMGTTHHNRVRYNIFVPIELFDIMVEEYMSNDAPNLSAHFMDLIKKGRQCQCQSHPSQKP